MNYKIFPLSENAVTIDFGNQISLELNQIVIELAENLEKNNFVGFLESVPAYSSLTVFFDLIKVKKNYAEFANAFSFVKSFIEKCLHSSSKINLTLNPVIEIPVNYSAEFSPDLEFVAEKSGLSIKEVIKIHTSKTYRVFMIGFLPAFAYLGKVDERIAVQRKEIPRTKIQKGSVGIAGSQTGIYPIESPGGWQIIGKTDLEMFQPQNIQISRLKTGDLVEFYDIGRR